MAWLALVWVCVCAIAGATEPVAGPPEEVSRVAALTLRVDDRAASLTAVREAAEAAGGWFSRLEPDRITVRVPSAQLDAVLDRAEGVGEVIERSYDRVDQGARLADLQARLSVRKEGLDRFLAVLDGARAEAVVQVEREITRVVAEIEGLEGELRVVRDRVAFGELTVGLTFRSRRAPLRDGSSSFAWLESLNVADLLSDLRAGVRGPSSACAAVAPEGFATWRGGARFQAVSPDDVIYRVRSARHRPEAALDFWKEALRTRMEAAGYALLSEAEVTAAGVPGVMIELGAAHGERDQTYLLAVFIRGGRLVIAEATGEAERFAARRAAVVDAIGKIAL